MDRRTFLAAGAATIALAHTSTQAFAAAGDADAALDRFLSQDFEHRLDRSPEQVSSLGLDKGPRAAQKSELADRSLDAWYRDRREAKQMERQLKAFDPAKLSPSARVSLDSTAFRATIEATYARSFNYGDARGNLEPYAVSQLTGAYQSVPDFLDNQHKIGRAHV